MLSFRDVRIEHEGGASLLQGLNLDAPSPGLLFLVGPGGAGKSSLLQALSRIDEGQGRLSGEVTLDGERPPRPIWLGQRDAIKGDAPWIERRITALRAALATPASWILLDEPTAGLPDEAIREAHALMREAAKRTMLVVATHDRGDCLALGGHTALIAGGTVQEYAPSDQFFSAPTTKAGQLYVETGNCGVTAPPPAPDHGLWWAVPGLLCGLPRPGLINDTAVHFQQLSSCQVKLLVCLEERVQYDASTLRELGIGHLHVPIADMAAPGLVPRLDLCRIVQARIERNEAVSVHCRGGLGRTGTVLASIFVWFGDTPECAIARVRAAQPHAIQSDAQLRFIADFAKHIFGWNERFSTPLPSTH